MSSDRAPEYLHDELCKAINDGDAELVKAIIQNGADVHYREPHGSSSLEVACGARRPNPRVVEVLLKNGANPNTQAYRTGYTSLQYTAVANSPDVVELLLQYGAYDAPDNDGNTAQDIATKCGFDKVVKLLNDAAIQ